MASPRKPRYDVCCTVCYTAVVASVASKRDANRAATSHLNAYGHNVFILDRQSRKPGQPTGQPTAQE